MERKTRVPQAHYTGVRRAVGRLGVGRDRAGHGVGTVSTLGLQGWQVASSAQVGDQGSRISRPGFATASWLPVTPDDAGAVGTEVGALVQNGRCPNVFYSTNMKACFGYMSQVGPDTIAQFAVPWWFRTTFRRRPGRAHEQLIINGVVGQADVWVNGTAWPATRSSRAPSPALSLTSRGCVAPGRQRPRARSAAQRPDEVFTLDNVDWTQIPPDNNTGIQFPIQLQTVQALAISDVHAVQHNAPDLSRSDLTLKAEVSNLTRTRQTATVTAILTAPGGGSARSSRR